MGLKLGDIYNKDSVHGLIKFSVCGSRGCYILYIGTFTLDEEMAP